MAKKRTLLDELKDSEPLGTLAWFERLKKCDPELYQQVMEIIDAYNNNDPAVLRVRPTKTSLAEWIIGKLPFKVRRTATITDYFQKRRNEAAR